MTRNGGWRLDRVLQSAVSKVDEIVIGVDAATTDDTYDRACRYTEKVLCLQNPHGIIEPHVATLVGECTADWVLRLDDDEVLCSSFSIEQLPAEVVQDFDLIGLPRPWLINRQPAYFVGTGGHDSVINPQYRLMRRRADWTFTGEIHTPGFQMKPAWESPTFFIYHLDLVDRSAVYRRRKYKRYEALGERPWNRDYLLNPRQIFESGRGIPCSSGASYAGNVWCFYSNTMSVAKLCWREAEPPSRLFARGEGD